MSSVTARIKEVKQPKGGYIRPSQFEEIIFNDDLILEEENIHSSILGMAVDYLTRFVNGTSLEKAFEISIIGYETRMMLLGKHILKEDQEKGLDVWSLLKQINGLDDQSIIAACKACTYDVWKRSLMGAMTARGAEEIMPDEATIKNIRIMVNRSISFWKKYGPVKADGFTFEKDGYSSVVDSGDGDYLTEDTLWDFKVSKSKLSSKHTLQLLMYWIMGQHSGKEEFKKVNRIGIFNPRLNTMYLLDMRTVSPEVIEAVERDVICY